MKKEFLDKLYERRATLQTKIDKLEEEDKQPRDAECKGCGDVIKVALCIRRNHFGEINCLIQEYLDIYR